MFWYYKSCYNEHTCASFYIFSFFFSSWIRCLKWKFWAKAQLWWWKRGFFKYLANNQLAFDKEYTHITKAVAIYLLFAIFTNMFSFLLVYKLRCSIGFLFIWICIINNGVDSIYTFWSTVFFDFWVVLYAEAAFDSLL